MAKPVAAAAAARIVRDAPPVQTAWLGNQLAVQFFVLAAPTILKSRHAPTGTLALFASLSLLWCLRGIVVPPLLAILSPQQRESQLLRLVLFSRLAIVLAFLVLAVVSSGVTHPGTLQRLLFLSGIVICTISGVERGLLEAASVLAADTRQRASALQFALSGSTGIVLAWIFCNGMVLPIDDRFGIAAAIAAAVTIGGFSVPLLSGLFRNPARRTTLHRRPLTESGGNIQASEKTRGSMIWKQTTAITVVLAFGWTGMDLAWRIAQPLVIRQGITLTSTGAAGVATSAALLALAALARLRAGKSSRNRTGFGRASELLSLVAVAALAVAGFHGGDLYAVAGYVVLQFGYFCFNVFTTELLIRCGQALESPGVPVSAAAIGYFVAHFSVVPVLYFSSTVPHAFGAIAVVAGVMLLIWKTGVKRIISMAAGASSRPAT